MKSPALECSCVALVGTGASAAASLWGEAGGFVVAALVFSVLLYGVKATEGNDR